jgi:3-dehydroquinate dehydratase II
MNTLFLINGPNLALLGLRNPIVYGHVTLTAIEQELDQLCVSMSVSLKTMQSDAEGEIISYIGGIFRDAKGGLISPIGFVINPGALAHTSVALRDAVEMLGELKLPIVEVHLSNIHAREDFRHKSFVSHVATGVVCGLGAQGYSLACQWILNGHLPKKV